jgi:hypothetical protein
MKRVLARSLTDTSTIRSSSLSFLHSLSSTTVADVDDPPSTVVAKLVTPSFLQPRVVLYDGVCHLCHRGITSIPILHSMFTNKHSSIHVLLCIVVTRNSEWCFVLLHFWFCLKFEIKLGFLCFKNVITRV